MDLKSIRDHWEKVGIDFQKENKITPTSRDPFLGELERKYILECLNNSYEALEIGCGDGQHTIEYSRKLKKIIGIDIADSLISIAKNRILEKKINNVDFIVTSVLDIDKYFKNESFDCIISQRCLINLPDWAYQKEAIIKLYSILKKGGIFLLTEGFQEELNNLNRVRENFSLPSIKVVDYNKNINRKDFESFISNYFEIVEIKNYGLYLFLSRVLHPLLVSPEQPKHDSKINEISMELSKSIPISEFEKYSYNLFYILIKK